MQSTSTVTLPQRLRAPDPGWTTRADVVVIGSGIAGLTAALRIHAEDSSLSLLVVTKDVLNAGSTQWAQGGIAAALGPGDTPEQHQHDTLVAGAGACDEEAVRVLVTEGPDAVRELIDLGTVFDHHPDGELSLTREGGHHRDRIAHAGGDATGAEIQRALIAAVERAPAIEVIQHALAVDLLRADDGGVAGVTLHVLGEGQRDGVGAVHCRAVVLASGGLGQVFSQSTNPSVSTGDGMALALRAGATLRDLEFVQFHPTVMYLGPDSQGQQPLISEAVRGEGAFLVDWECARFMQGEHELADLAPRDVVAKAITRRMIETGRPHMWLDARHLGAAFWERRFPTILAVCRAHGIDPATDLIPVAPAQPLRLRRGRHRPARPLRRPRPLRHRRGGLLRRPRRQPAGLQLAARGARLLPADRRGPARRAPALGRPGRRRPASRRARRRGPPPSAAGADDRPGSACSARPTASEPPSTGCPAWAPTAEPTPPASTAWETTNLLSLSTALAGAALLREETRGSHWREDFPERDDVAWAGHVDSRLVDGVLRQDFVPAPSTDPSTPTAEQR